MLGWLMFDKSIKPQRLERVMSDVMPQFPQLRIVEVLVKCCCPRLPSSATSDDQRTCLQSPMADLHFVSLLPSHDYAGIETHAHTHTHTHTHTRKHTHARTHTHTQYPMDSLLPQVGDSHAYTTFS